MKLSSKIGMAAFSGASFIALMATTSSAVAQEADTESTERKLQVVTVTAQKKEESVQTVPIAISTFTAEELEARGVFTVESLEVNTPGFTFDELGTSKVRTAIRGIGSDNTSPGQEFSTVIFLDGIAQTTNGLAAVNLFDVERVEVLKGPQGTLWGAGAIGGGINVITAGPTDRNEGRLSATLGNYGRFDLAGVANFAVNDSFRHRFAVAYNALNGYADNAITGNKLEDLQRLGLRYSADIDLSERATFGLVADYTSDDNSGRNYQILGGTPGGSRAPTWDLLVANRTNDSRVSLDDDVGFAERDMWGIRGELNVDLDWATFTNVTSYRSIKDAFFDNNDGASPEEIAAAADEVDNRGAEFGLGTADDADQFSTEFRLAGRQGAVDWTLGAFYGTASGNQLARFQIQQIDCRASNPNATVGIVGVAGSGCTTGAFSEDRWNISNTTDTVAVFGEVKYDVTDAFSLTGGLRWSEYEKNYSSDNLQTIGSPIVSGAPGQVAVRNITQDAITYRVIADYDFGNGLFAYASYATGYAPSDFGAFVSNIGTQLTEQDAKSTEIGLKGTFDNFQFNTAIFTNNFSGTPVVQVNGGGGGGAAGNSQDVGVQGFETDIRWAPVDALQIDLKYAYLQTEANGTPFGDNLELQRAPENDVTLNAVYYVSDSIQVGGGYNYRSMVFDDPDNNLGEVRPSREIFNAYALWDLNSGFSVRVWGRNLADEDYVTRISDSFQSRVVNYGAPRTFGVTLSKDF